MARTRWMRPAVVETLCAGLALVALHPLTIPGHLWAHDTGAHLFRLVEVAQALRDGVLYPRFLPDAYGGLGGPILTFNPAGPYYLPALLVVAGAGPIAALKVAAGLLMLAGGLSMRVLARPHLGRAGSAVAGLAWVYLPYRIANLYVRMAYSELALMAVLPLAMAAARRAALRPTAKRVAVAALLAAGLPALHFPGSVLGLPLVVVWALASAAPGRGARALKVTAAIVTLGLALSSFSWLPAMAEIGRTHYRESATGPDHYAHHFVSLEQMVSPAWGFGSSMPGESDRMSFQAGWAHLLVLAAAAGAAGRVRAVRRLVALCSGVALGGLFLMHPISRGLWAVVPVLQNVQFPWRALMLVGIATSFAAGIVAVLPAVVLAKGGSMRGDRDRKVRAASSSVKGSRRGHGAERAPAAGWRRTLMLWMRGEAVGDAEPSRGPLGRRAWGLQRGLARALKLDASFRRLGSARLVTVIVIALLVAACLPYLRARRGEGTDADFTPAAFRGRYFGELKFQPVEVGAPNFRAQGPRALLLSGGGARIVEEATHRMTLQVDPLEQTTLRVHLFASPGWEAGVDGEPAEVRAEPGTGLVLVDIPRGGRRVELRYAGTSAAKAGWALSGVALLTAAGMVAAGRLGGSGRRWSAHRRVP